MELRRDGMEWDVPVGGTVIPGPPTGQGQCVESAGAQVRDLVGGPAGLLKSPPIGCVRAVPRNRLAPDYEGKGDSDVAELPRIKPSLEGAIAQFLASMATEQPGPKRKSRVYGLFSSSSDAGDPTASLSNQNCFSGAQGVTALSTFHRSRKKNPRALAERVERLIA